MRIVSVPPLARYIEADPFATLDIATLPRLKPRSNFRGALPASFAARSTILSVGDFFPFFQMISVRIFTFLIAVRNRFQRSGFSMGTPAGFIHLFDRQVTGLL